MYKSPSTGGAPRSLRTIAEAKNSAGAFVTDPPLPRDDVSGGKYDDAAMAATTRLSSAARSAAGEKTPFKNIRGG